MTRGNKIIVTVAILMVVMIWYFTEQGIIGKKQGALNNVNPNVNASSLYSMGTLEQGIITGCTDPQAENYNAQASSDNGLCYFNAGCCDVNATNYDAQADSCNVPNNNVIMCNYS